jgi:hypothetical protein
MEGGLPMRGCGEPASRTLTTEAAAVRVSLVHMRRRHKEL